MQKLCDAIQYLFQDILFIPLDFLRKVQLDSWWAANTINWIFIVIVFGFFIYWIKQLKLFSDKKEDRDDIVAHSFFK